MESPIDELVNVLPIHYTNSHAPNIQIHQFPLFTRPLQIPPSAVLSGKRISARIKSNVHRLEIHIPADSRPEVWNTDRTKELGVARAEDDHEKNQDTKEKEGEEPRLSEIRLRSEEIFQRGVHMLGVVRAGKLHLHPITQTHQFRPNLTYLDVLSRKNKRFRGGGSDSESDDGPPLDPDDPIQILAIKKERKTGEVREVQVSARKVDDRGAQSQGGLSAVRREILHIMRTEEDEDWEDLQFCDETSTESEEAFEGVFSQSGEILLCKTNMTAFLKEIHGL
ncbi:hypothetical protein BDZ94DRAFT_1276109 [Collybia nuda]|uniref:Uncharacterized protein n=1 Tax=Collybia nuda TaxID=64659 RepID=A0A9P5XRJ6_9AGAR|nr:hypothetical protein BDZ94DRAFT_1276109 [Collybia nuda]